VDFLEGPAPTVQRRLAGLEASLAHGWRPVESWGLGLSAGLTLFSASTDGHAATLERARLSLRLTEKQSPVPLTIRLETGRVEGSDPSFLDRFHLGGQGTSLVPSALDANRIEQAALPSYTETGNRLRRSRVELGGVFRAYVEHTAVWDGTQPRPAYLRVGGLEFSPDELVPDRLLDTLIGRMHFVLGCHRVLGEGSGGKALRDRNSFTASVVLKP
jgi:hypothetical protein